jgi:glycosyltransferase involved in cell wall biosynthesis
MKRLLIAEESLRDLKGHWFDLIQVVEKTAKHMGWQVDVAMHNDAVPEIVTSFNSYKVFKHAKYLDNNKKLPFERYYSFILHSYRIFKQIKPFLKSKESYDVILVPTVMVHHLLAWYLVMFLANKPKHLTLFFITNPGEWNPDTKAPFFPKSTLILKKLLLQFKKLTLKGKVTLAVGTIGNKAEFEKLTGLPFTMSPQPVPIDSENVYRLKSSLHKTDTIVFSCLGFARHEKGSDLLKAAIEKILRQNPGFDGHFMVQWVDPFTMPDGTLCQPDDFLTTHPKVTIIDKGVLADEYVSLLAKTDCMVLPYRNSSYYARVSQVATECTCIGTPMIYTKGGWLEETVTGYGAGIGVADESVEDLTNAILQMQEQYATHKSAAESVMEKARQYYSPEHFVSLLLN